MENETEGHRIFIGRIKEVDEMDVVTAFRTFGNIIDWNFYPRRPFGFISYDRKVSAENAIENMNGKYLGDRALLVEWADGWPRDDEQEESVDSYDAVFNMTCENNCSVHCKGLPRYTTKETLEGIFYPFGVIEEISLFTDRSDYAFIKFNSKEAATLAICAINNTEIEGSQVKCSWSYRPNYRSDQFVYAASTSSDSSSISSHSSDLESDEFDRIFNATTPNNRTVYCGDLSPAVTTELMKEIFSPFGIVESITLFNDRSGFGFIRFNTKEAAALAICSINNTLIEGRQVRCNWSHREEFSTELQSFESSPEDSWAEPISHLTDRLERISTQFELGDVPGAAAASSLLPAEKSEEVIKEKKMNMLCKICMDEELGVVFLPCGHLTSCTKCSLKIVSCPVCRKHITNKVRTYLS